MKSIKYLFEGYCFLSLLVDGFPDYAVGSFAEFDDEIVFLEDVGLHFFTHCCVG